MENPNRGLKPQDIPGNRPPPPFIQDLLALGRRNLNHGQEGKGATFLNSTIT